MNITEAALATRKYSVWCAHDDRKPWVWEDGKRLAGPFEDYPGARAVCDRLNLLAVLKALREPSEGMVTAAERACGLWEGFLAEEGWRAMIDAAIKEIEAHG